MKWKNSQTEWGMISRMLHWTMALAILAMCLIGITMINLPTSPLKIDLFRFHKSLGLLLLLLAIIRLFWRVLEPAPQLPDDLSAKEKFLARAGQTMIYVLLILIPVSGWVIHSAANLTEQWFGLFVIPSITNPNIEIEAYAKTAHLALIVILGLAVSAHVAAALRHHYINKNNILNNMLGRKQV